MADLAAHEADWVEPLGQDYRGIRVARDSAQRHRASRR